MKKKNGMRNDFVKNLTSVLALHRFQRLIQPKQFTKSKHLLN